MDDVAGMLVAILAALRPPVQTKAPPPVKHAPEPLLKAVPAKQPPPQ